MRCTKCTFRGVIFFAIAGLALTFCSQPETPVGKVEDLPSVQPVRKDSAPKHLVVEDTLQREQVKPIQKRSRFFDHIAFKKVKGGSNSGGKKKYKYWDVPGDTGMFYRYMLFNTPRNITEVSRFRDCELVVYKLTGEPGFYSDTNEVLIELYCAFPDPDLGKLDIIGKHLDEIKADFHAPGMSEDNTYAYDLGDGYTLFVRNDPITAFRLVRLNDKLSKQAFDEAFNR